MMEGIYLLFFIGAAASILLYKFQKAAAYIGFGISAIASAAGVWFFIVNMTGGCEFKISMPVFDAAFAVDPLSAFFSFVICLVALAASIYGIHYAEEYKDSVRIGAMGFFFNLFIVSMLLVVAAANVFWFMVFWEFMTLSSFFLIHFNDSEKTAGATILYMVIAHVGGAAILAAMLLMSSTAGSMNFSDFSDITISPVMASIVFLLFFFGFGSKAGVFPVHVWLPKAHPAAPSHVSALMSAVMIKTAIYGIIRCCMWLPLSEWWGILILVFGALSSLLGVLYALTQHDTKALLAYHSVENIGIILLGLGIGITGRAYNYNTVSALGFAGALLHIVNHAFFKGLLFLGAGAVIRQTGTGEIDRLGGLIKKLPWTGTLFLSGSAAIAGLPFFNGFISELMIYISSATGAVKSGGSVMPMISAITVISLAVIGGLASICFTKIFGTVFQGHPRKTDISNITEVPFLMKSGMLFPAFFIVFIGMAAFLVIPFLENPVSLFAGDTAGGCLIKLENIFIRLSIILFSILFFIIVLLGIKGRIYKKRAVKVNETWGCGYSFPADTMQYTASSYADPLIDKSRYVLSGKKEKKFDSEYFPGQDWSFKSEVNDWFLSRIFTGAGKIIDRIFRLLRWFQCGKAGVYVIYIAFTVIIMIVWKFVL